jgi:hypothetical protein
MHAQNYTSHDGESGRPDVFTGDLLVVIGEREALMRLAQEIERPPSC